MRKSTLPILCLFLLDLGARADWTAREVGPEGGRASAYSATSWGQEYLVAGGALYVRESGGPWTIVDELRGRTASSVSCGRFRDDSVCVVAASGVPFVGLDRKPWRPVDAEGVAQAVLVGEGGLVVIGSRGDSRRTTGYAGPFDKLRGSVEGRELSRIAGSGHRVFALCRDGTAHSSEDGGRSFRQIAGISDVYGVRAGDSTGKAYFIGASALWILSPDSSLLMMEAPGQQIVDVIELGSEGRLALLTLYGGVYVHNPGSVGFEPIAVLRDSLGFAAARNDFVLLRHEIQGLVGLSTVRDAEPIPDRAGIRARRVRSIEVSADRTVVGVFGGLFEGAGGVLDTPIKEGTSPYDGWVVKNCPSTGLLAVDGSWLYAEQEGRLERRSSASYPLGCTGRPGTILAGRQVQRSTDGGRTWTIIRAGLESEGRLPLVETFLEDPVARRILVSMVGDGLFESFDDGLSWGRVFLPMSASERFLSLAGGDGRMLLGGTAGVGVAWSRDGGATWETSESSSALGRVAALLADPDDPAVYYAGGTSGLFYTNDAGVNWRAIGTGLATREVTALAVRGDRLLVGTAGGVGEIPRSDLRIDAVRPSRISECGGVLSVMGWNLDATLNVFFGGVPVRVIEERAPSQILVRVPAVEVGATAISVRTSSGFEFVARDLVDVERAGPCEAEPR